MYSIRQFVLDYRAGELRDTVQVQLPVNIVLVNLDGLGGDAKLDADAFEVQALRDQSGDLQFPLAESFEAEQMNATGVMVDALEFG